MAYQNSWIPRQYRHLSLAPWMAMKPRRKAVLTSYNDDHVWNVVITPLNHSDLE